MDYARDAQSQRTKDSLRKRHQEENLRSALDDLEDALENAESCLDEIQALISKLLPGETTNFAA
jgi:hypothetical protein